MTPLQIEIMLWYYARPENYRPANYMDGTLLPPAVIDEIRFFEEAGMLTQDMPDMNPTPWSATYFITPKGRAYVEFLLSVPMPVEQWIVPRVFPLAHDTKAG